MFLYDFLCRLSGCNVGATPAILCAHNALCGQNYAGFVHFVDAVIYCEHPRT